MTEYRKYWSKSVYIDVTSGEVLTAWKAEREYITIKTTKSYEFDGKRTIIIYTHECRPSGQLKLWDEPERNHYND